MVLQKKKKKWKLLLFIWFISEWHCEDPLNVFIIIGPKVRTLSLCRFPAAPPRSFQVSPSLPWLSVLLKFLRNLSTDFKRPLIGCSRHTDFSRLAGINTKRKWQSLCCSSSAVSLCVLLPDCLIYKGTTNFTLALAFDKWLMKIYLILKCMSWPIVTGVQVYLYLNYTHDHICPSKRHTEYTDYMASSQVNLNDWTVF